MREIKILVAVVAVLPFIVAVPATASNKLDLSGITLDVTPLTRFELWNACLPIFPSVQIVSHVRSVGDPTQDAARRIVARLLRGARLYPKDSITASQASALFITVNVEKTFYFIKIEYQKPVRDLATGLSRSHGTWRRYLFELHDNDPNSILVVVGNCTRDFINQYLTVNREACLSATE